MNYLFPIKTAILLFPFIALLLSFPFILVQYHKYGSISFMKVLLTYSFTFYIVCAYFLVILPLPKIEKVLLLNTPKYQLIPFKFIYDFILKSGFILTNPSTYLTAFKSNYFLSPLFNIFLTIPFGLYLRYFFKCDLKKTCLYSFFLSLFFELTQLSGLYFIYPRPYRLFDVDDLILNTLGGLIGYYIFTPFKKVVPSIDNINEDSINKGLKVTGFRRTTLFLLDLFLFMCLYLIIEIIFSGKINSFIILSGCIIIHYFIFPVLRGCHTPGEKYLKLQVVDKNEMINPIRYILRKLLFIILYILIPIIIYKFLLTLNNTNYFEFLIFIYIVSLILSYFYLFIKYVFSNKTLLYEKLSKTKLISTIKKT